jgi:hypothetical protein
MDGVLSLAMILVRTDSQCVMFLWKDWESVITDLTFHDTEELPSMFKVKTVLLFTSFYLFCFFETGSHYATQAGLKTMILLPQSPKCWDYGLLGLQTARITDVVYHVQFINSSYLLRVCAEIPASE